MNTRKILVLVVFLFAGIFSKNVFSQEKMISGGLKVGWTYSYFANYIDYDEFSKFQHGITAGGFFMFKPSQNFYASIECLYTQQGANNIEPTAIYLNNSPALTNLTNLDIRMHTLEVPILLRPRVELMRGIGIYAIAGASFVYNLQTDARLVRKNTLGNGISYSESYDNVTSKLKSYEIAPQFGVGFNLDELLFLSLEVKYKLGVQDLNNSTIGNDFSNNVILVTLGIGI